MRPLKNSVSKKLTETKNHSMMSHQIKKREPMPSSSSALTRMPWEKHILEALIDLLKPTGNVLEVGFALGYSSERIQTYHPKHHTIIEKDPKIAARATEWAKGKANVTVIHDTWEHALSKLAAFDAIFFNEFDPHLAVELSQHHETGAHLVKQGKEIIAKAKEQIPELLTMRYSDDDLNTFLAQTKPAQKTQVSVFLAELKSNQQITNEQYEQMLTKYALERKEPSLTKCASTPVNPLLLFLKACMQSHMHKNSRLTYFAGAPLSNYEYPLFFDLIITNPDYDYQEQFITVDVPPSCAYYPYKNALLPLIEKMV